MAEIDLPLNLEMAATEEMLAIALAHRPHAACIVPEKREERTTEGGLDAAGQHNHLAYYVDKLGAAGIRVSLFIEPTERQVEAALRLGAPVVEFHTGRYAHAEGEERSTELKRIADCAALAVKNGIEPHAGHGLTFDNVVPVAAIPQIAELNIGHFLIGEAIFTGLDASVRRMRELMDEREMKAPLPLREREGPIRAANGRVRRRGIFAPSPPHPPRYARHPLPQAGEGLMIVGIGSDLCNIERIEKIARSLRRPLPQPGVHRNRARQGCVAPAHPRRDIGKTLRGEGGILESGRHRVQARRVHEGHRRR